MRVGLKTLELIWIFLSTISTQVKIGEKREHGAIFSSKIFFGPIFLRSRSDSCRDSTDFPPFYRDGGYECVPTPTFFVLFFSLSSMDNSYEAY